jgi:predicted glycosyltransferase
MSRPLASPKVLVVPLDWGLGHATRCVPIITQLLITGCTVLLAGSGKVKAVLEQEFPQLSFLNLPGYEIEYAATSWGLPFKIVAQIPKLLSAIKKEQQWLKKVVEGEGIDAVIADNRYGLHHPKIVSVFVTHQLRIKAPVTVVENILQHLNYRFINQFTNCWVPDAEAENNLAGELSHPEKTPRTDLQYIGLLSRFTGKINGEEKHLLIILSGPEPQRTLLENSVVKDLEGYTEPVVLIRGLPQAKGSITLASNVSVYNHLPSNEMEKKIKEASFVISRCGYSTVMDLAALQKKSILIATPGQTEQEYLAMHLMKKRFALCVEQKKFKLKNALELAQSFKYNIQIDQRNNLQNAIQSLLKEIDKRKSLASKQPI